MGYNISEIDKLSEELANLTEDERKCLNSYARREGYAFRLYAYMQEIQENVDTEKKMLSLLAKLGAIRNDNSYVDLNKFLYSKDKTIEGGFVPPITEVLKGFEK